MSETRRFKVVIAGFGFPDSEPEIEQLGDIADVVTDPASVRDAFLEVVSDADAIIVDSAHIDDEVMAAAKNLKVIAGYGVGVDQIDVEAAVRRGIVVCNSPEAMSNEVAEHAISLLFALARQSHFADADVRLRQTWEPLSPSYRPILLRGKTLAVVGFGRTGSRTGRIAAGIGMKLLVYDPYINPGQLDFPGDWDIRFGASLQEVVGKADAVVLHVPLTDETRRMVDAEALGTFKPGNLLINVSRGGVIDQAALYEALKNGRLAGAALDVFDPEPPSWDEPLLKLPNLIATPHMAWRSESSGRRMQTDASSEVRRILLGETPRWRVG